MQLYLVECAYNGIRQDSVYSTSNKQFYLDSIVERYAEVLYSYALRNKEVDTRRPHSTAHAAS